MLPATLSDDPTVTVTGHADVHGLVRLGVGCLEWPFVRSSVRPFVRAWPCPVFSLPPCPRSLPHHLQRSICVFRSRTTRLTTRRTTRRTRAEHYDRRCCCCMMHVTLRLRCCKLRVSAAPHHMEGPRSPPVPRAVPVPVPARSDAMRLGLPDAARPFFAYHAGSSRPFVQAGF